MTCPDCHAPLREFGDKLVCDTCQAMLIRLEELAAAVTELDGQQRAAEARDLQSTDVPCPRCATPMSSCIVALGGASLPTRHYCAAHGMWIRQKVMTALFARASYLAHAGRGSVHGPGGVSLPADTGLLGGMAGPMRTIGAAFGASAPADAGLMIARYRAPRVHTVFVSAFKDRKLTCPACGAALEYAGDRWLCASCRGAFVETAALESMIAAMTNESHELPAVDGKPGARACPICSEHMVVEEHSAAVIDHCPAHGVWFDERELAAILFHAGEHKPATRGGWLRRLFHHER